MTLFDCTDAPYARLTRIFVAEKGIAQPPTRTVDPRLGEARTPEFMAKNPWAAVPVLELDDGTCLSESIAICQYFEETHPEPPLFGKGPLARAQICMWTRRAEWGLFFPLGEMVRHLSPPGSAYHGFVKGMVKDPARGEAVSRSAAISFGRFDAALAERPFIAAATLTIADVVAYVAIDTALHAEFGFALPEDRPHLRRWFESMSARPSARA